MVRVQEWMGQASLETLVEVRRSEPAPRRLVRFGREMLLCAAGGTLPTRPTPLCRRTVIDPKRRADAFVRVAGAMLPTALCVSAIAAVPLASAMVGFGVFDPRVLAAAVTAMFLGPLLHEAGHALVLPATPACVIISGLRGFVLHGPIAAARVRAVAVAGPALCVVVGAAMTVTAAIADLPALQLAGVGLVLHAVGLSALSPDGRTAAAGR